MSRTFGWVQDGGSFVNLKRVVSAIIPNSPLNIELRKNLIPKYIPERFKQKEIIEAITEQNCNAVSYDLFKGYGSSNQLTVEENVTMFGYSIKQARSIVAKKGRGKLYQMGCFTWIY